ncbi:hypothetical protein ANN_16114 [Periplaneta americana]|uniref:Ionotropic glutamate receptor C-terminal domain-containing protein n=1 Tax=Periplaneta americana TaxID=6978 RepID=A0ABQ8SJB0_PERAM|nr:hypothetical protein ANN_16114 [Periplaneta americana]
MATNCNIVSYYENSNRQCDLWGAYPYGSFDNGKQPLYPYFIEEITWFVPSGDKIPLWQAPIRIFNQHMWILVALSFFMGSLTFWLIHNFENGFFRYQIGITEVIMNTLKSYLGTGMQEFSNVRTSRLYQSLWLFFCLHIYTAYQSALITFLFSPGYLPPIKDVEELNNSGINLGSMIDDDNVTAEYPVCDSLCLDRVAYDRDLALLAPRFLTSLIVNSYYTDEEGPRAVPLNENVMFFYASIYFNFDSILVDRFNSIHRRLFSTGITRKWCEQLEFESRERRNIIPRRDKCSSTADFVRGNAVHVSSEDRVMSYEKSRRNFDSKPRARCENHNGSYLLFQEYAIRKVQDNTEGLEMTGLHQLLVYADEVNMLRKNPQTIRENAEILVEAGKAIGLEVNPENTKYMIMSRDQNIVRNGNIKIGDLSFEEVEKFKYLGATVTNINDTREEIKRRINMGNSCYYSVKKLLSSSLLSKNLKVRIYKTVILPVVLYGCETWTLTLREEQRLRVFENKVLRKIFGAKRDEVTGEWRAA